MERGFADLRLPPLLQEGGEKVAGAEQAGSVIGAARTTEAGDSDLREGNITL